MNYFNINLHLFLENLVFLIVATFFSLVVGYAWRNSKPMIIPNFFPLWVKIWFRTVQIIGVLLPLPVMIWWGIFRGYELVLSVYLSYFIMLALQIVAEIITLRTFQSVVWVMVPYLYLPYRIWQLYEGLMLLPSDSELIWVRNVLILEIVVWIVNYILDVSQLPKLFSWETKDNM